MKRFIGLILILFIFYFGIQVGYKYFSHGFEEDYYIQKEDHAYHIHELYRANYKNEASNYFITVQTNDTSFSYQVYQDFIKADRIITDIESYEGNQYTCILPIFRGDQILFDITCENNGSYMYYHDLIGREQGLDEFANSLQEVGYSLDQFADQATGETTGAITSYQGNLAQDHYLVFQSYRGIYAMNNALFSRLYQTDLFSKDIYNMSIHALVGKYYVVADYNENYEFRKFYLIDVTNAKQEVIEYQTPISFDAYVQGVVDNSMYLFDPNARIQYELNVKTKTIVAVGNVENQIHYYQNGEWSKVSAYRAVNQPLYFENSITTTEFSGYTRVDQTGKEHSGYYYFYERIGNGYRVYRANTMKPEERVYLFTVDRIDQIQYVDDYVYYINGNTIYYYHDATGIRKLYTYRELGFNNNLHFYVYH